MRNYEIMYIVRPTLGVGEVNKVVDAFTDILTNNGATIKETKSLGQRELAYEIKDFKSGYYYVTTVTSKDDAAIKEFDRVAKNSKDIVRHLITKIGD